MIVYTKQRTGDFMRDFLNRIFEFMRDRYGHDQLNTALLVFTALVYFINLFARTSWLFILAVIPLILYIYRAMSRNINRRLYENRIFLEIWGKVTAFFKRQYMKIKDFKTHRYVRCPYCKAHLRLKKRTGIHTIHCPKCNSDFKKNILF